MNQKKTKKWLVIKLPIVYFLLMYVLSCSSNNISSLNESDIFKIIDNKKRENLNEKIWSL